MVTEAVAELKGAPIARVPDINIDLPIEAYLPNNYVEAEEQRLEAYRRLAAVTELIEVADIEAEWIDRYGPVPEAAQTLLHAALLRSECVRLAIADISVTHRNRVRVSPIELTQSEQIRYQRLIGEDNFNGGTYKEDFLELTIHLQDVGPKLPGDIFNFLRELRPTK